MLLQQITAGVSVSASGISSWTLDIGGFTGLDVDSDEGRELFVRWLSMGTFLPYVRRFLGFTHPILTDSRVDAGARVRRSPNFDSVTI